MNSDPGEGFALNQHYFHYDDIEGLVGLYGLDSTPQTRLYEDCDLSSASFALAGTNNLPLITDMAAAPRPPLGTVSSVIVGGRARSTLYMEWFPIWEWNWSTQAATNIMTFATPGLRSTGPIGVSASTTHVALATHPPRLSSDRRMWRRQVRAVSRPLSGSGELTGTLSPAEGTVADTAVAGVSSAYHQPTNAWLHVLRDKDGQVLLVGWRPTEGWSNVLPMGFRSFAQPSIACSPNRCFIAFVEVPSRLGVVSTQTRLQWTEGTVSWPVTVPIPSNLSFTYTAGITTSWYNVVSDPVASVVSNPAGGWFYYVSTSWPQRAGGAWGTRPLVYRRSEGVQGTGALVQLTPLLPHAPGVAESPTAGATGVCAELFTSRSP